MNAGKSTIESAEGKCLCGAVKITVKQVSPLISVCHCRMCRQSGGGPNMAVSCDNFSVEGRDHVTSYASSDWAERAFCSKCGSNLWYRFTPNDHFSFSAGLFEFDSEVEFERQVFVDEKPAFYDFSQKTPMMTSTEAIAEAEAAGHNFDG